VTVVAPQAVPSSMAMHAPVRARVQGEGKVTHRG
jgi:hypothetical protein